MDGGGPQGRCHNACDLVHLRENALLTNGRGGSVPTVDKCVPLVVGVAWSLLTRPVWAEGVTLPLLLLVERWEDLCHHRST